MAAKTKPTSARWQGTEQHLLNPLKRIDGTYSTHLEYGSEWLLSELPEDVLANPSMVVTNDAGRTTETPTEGGEK